MTPDQVLQSLEAQRLALFEAIQLMPKGSSQRQSQEDLLKQQDAQLAHVVAEYKRQGNA